MFYLIDCLPQFIDRTNDIGGQWNRFTKGIRVKPKCPAKCIAIKAFVVCIGFLVCFVSASGFYRESVLSAISAAKLDTISTFNFGATVNTYSTLSCNTDNKNEMQCLVLTQPQFPETRNCYTTHESVNHSFCGRLCK